MQPRRCALGHLLSFAFGIHILIQEMIGALSPAPRFPTLSCYKGKQKGKLVLLHEML